MKKLFKNLLSSDSWSKHFSETVKRMGKNNAGFSLVELIVVIAIMAILAAVAVVGVSVYIPKAQQANDEQMIADIKYAISLYTSGETLTPGQSGYVVVHKNGGVSVGGSLDAAPDQLITNALKATFGDNYASELKVAYKDWKGMLNSTSGAIINDSTYSDNPEVLLENVQDLADKLSAYYGGGTEAAQQANQTVLDIAKASNSYIDSDALVTWWTNAESFSAAQLDLPGVVDAPDELVANDAQYELKAELAIIVARVNAFVTYTNCPGCNEAYASGNADLQITDPAQALGALDDVTTKLKTHINDCDTCKACLATDTTNSYWTNNAANDAKAYLALMGQVDKMSGSIQNSEEFSSGGLFTSDYVTNTVNGYVSAAEAYSASGANAQDGDILVIALVSKNGEVVYQVYPLDYN